TSGYGLLGIKPRKIIPRLSKTVPTGNFKIDVPASADTNKHSYVLIWCKQFTVLFGSAQLK
ncbi:MAG: DM13 domain-containing protein, partial [Saprospiraceae bacterium]|nr:DM13 domain-containing protein [Saprospiraceae bacterium]